MARFDAFHRCEGKRPISFQATVLRTNLWGHADPGEKGSPAGLAVRRPGLAGFHVANLFRFGTAKTAGLGPAERRRPDEPPDARKDERT